MWTLFGLLDEYSLPWQTKRESHGQQLLQQAPKKFQKWLTDLYRVPNQQLQQMLEQELPGRKIDIKAAGWQL